MLKRKTKTKETIAVVFPGGGISASFGVGCAVALKQIGLIPDIIIGSSGNAPTATYLGTNQPELAEYMWRTRIGQPDISRPGILSENFSWHLLKNYLATEDKKVLHSLVNIDAIMDQIKAHPPDFEQLNHTGTELLLATTSYRTGYPHFFSSRRHLEEWMTVINASMAIPFYYGKKIRIGHENFIDGDVSCTTASYLQLARQNGATTVILCDSRNEYPPEMVLDIIEAFISDKRLRKLFISVMEQNLASTIMPDPAFFETMRVIELKPRKQLPTGLLNNAPDAIAYSIELGKKRALQNKALRSLLK